MYDIPTSRNGVTDRHHPRSPPRSHVRTEFMHVVQRSYTRGPIVVKTPGSDWEPAPYSIAAGQLGKAVEDTAARLAAWSVKAESTRG
jgi:hypothetical protein